MHEVSIAEGIFDIVRENIQEYQLKKINRVVLKIGEFTCVEDHALRFAFEAFAKDTEAEGAELRIHRVKATAQCDECGEIFNISFTDKICPRCKTFSSKIITGYELSLDEIEGD